MTFIHLLRNIFLKSYISNLNPHFHDFHIDCEVINKNIELSCDFELELQFKRPEKFIAKFIKLN